MGTFRVLFDYLFSSEFILSYVHFIFFFEKVLLFIFVRALYLGY